MQYFSFRLEDGIVKQLEKVMKEFHYNTKTDFFREAVREKLVQLEEKRALKHDIELLKKWRGAFKGKVKEMSDEEFIEWRKQYGEELAKKCEKMYGWKS